MSVMTSEWKGRLEHWLRTLKDDLYTPLGAIQWECFTTFDYLSLEQAKNGPFQPIPPNYQWGKTWEYGWFRGSVTIPENAAGERIVMNLAPGSEATIFVNNQSFGTYRREGIPVPHQYVEDNILTNNAVPGEQFEIVLEVYAGHDYPRNPVTGGENTGPVLPGAYDCEAKEPRRKMGVCTYGIWNEDAYQLYMDAETLYMLLETLDERSLRAANIADALEKFTLVTDFEQDRASRIASYKVAREVLRPALEAKNGSTMPVFYCVGHAHIDLPWLWPMQESERKTSRTFAAQLRHLENYPEYKFIQSQPAAYEMCRKHYPELFERVREAIRQGRWIADGGMWVEPDTNVTSGESLIRQLIHGKRYYKDILGVDSVVLWLPDTFGYSAALPQILKGCGMDYLVTQKIFWSYNEGERFPYHYFTWEGMDGSQITAFLPTNYNYRTDPKMMNETWQNRAQKRNLDTFLIPFGHGDGGGGPARDFMEFARRQNDLEGGVKLKIASPLEFFKDMDLKGGSVNRYVGELYFSAHRGTYTSQAAIKMHNRKSELALREMEFWSSLAKLKGASYDISRADGLWKDLLSMQFHDILPGSSIARVYEEAEAVHHNVQAKASDMLACALAALTVKSEDAVTAANSLSFARKALIDVPQSFANGAVTVEGEAVAVGEVDGQLKAYVEIPSVGAISILPAETAAKSPEATVCQNENGFVLENAKVKAIVDNKGEVTSFVLKESGREFVSGAANRFRLFKDVPRLFDAWDIDSNYVLQEIEAARDVSVKVVCDGLVAALEVTGSISGSTFTQRITLVADSNRLEFDTTIDWKELHRLLKVSFPVSVYSENTINEIQFGYIQRPTHRSRAYDKDRFEVCNHRYTALCDNTHGAAVLNDCKYGISVNDNAMELTLLRASTSPAMRADNRVHHFTYAFTAWEGSFRDADVVRQGYELNVKPVVVSGKTQRFSAVNIDQENIILDTMKPAEDGSDDIVLRFYEAKKGAVKAKIALNIPAKRVVLCDMLENELEEITANDGCISLDFKAFEVKTIRCHMT